MNKLETKYLIIITGPTGIGKTKLSIELANYFSTEIISADSRQIYKELNIGTACPDNEELNAAKHYFIGNKSIFDNYNAARYEEEVIELLNQLFQHKNIVILAGGSGMYIDAVCSGIDYFPDTDFNIRADIEKQFEEYGIENLRFELKKLDPDYYQQVDLKNRNRIIKALEVCRTTGKPYSQFLTKPKKERIFTPIKIALYSDRNLLYQKINARVDEMIEKGLLEEAKKYYQYKHLNSLNTVGYKELFDYFAGKHSLERAIELIKQNSRRYAKRQQSWIRRAADYKWFQNNEIEKIKEYVNTIIN